MERLLGVVIHCIPLFAEINEAIMLDRFSKNFPNENVDVPLGVFLYGLAVEGVPLLIASQLPAEFGLYAYAITRVGIGVVAGTRKTVNIAQKPKK